MEVESRALESNQKLFHSSSSGQRVKSEGRQRANQLASEEDGEGEDTRRATWQHVSSLIYSKRILGFSS